MKESLKLATIMVLMLIGYCSYAQTDSLSIAKSSPTLSAKDSLYLDNLSRVVQDSYTATIPRFKLYKTENIYNLIKLDTMTGALWQVQYSMNKNASAMEVAIDDSSLLRFFDTPVAGRYELYATNNMYTFILLDTQKGHCYQVQWSTNPNQRFRARIY